MLSPIPEILEDLRQGRSVILVDDEDRENEGDLVCAAEKITPEIINFMIRHTPGYLCVALAAADCDRLELHPQAPANTSLRARRWPSRWTVTLATAWARDSIHSFAALFSVGGSDPQ